VKRLLAVVLLLFSSLLLIAAGKPSPTVAASSLVTAPTVTGPVTGGKGSPTLISTTIDPAAFGYTQQEYFLEGTASAYTSDVPLSADGLWTVHPQSSAPYKTRIVVYRPKNAKKFNGTVFVEWNNVSAGFDVASDWGSGHLAVLREGAAWIAVTAQAVAFIANDLGAEAEMDGQGRVLFSPELRRELGMEDQPVKVYGYAGRIEVINERTYDERKAAAAAASKTSLATLKKAGLK
jgi:hypothetical protein